MRNGARTRGKMPNLSPNPDAPRLACGPSFIAPVSLIREACFRRNTMRNCGAVGGRRVCTTVALCANGPAVRSCR
jgi:hypothetical protein